MRIAVFNSTRREVGGVERYLSRILPELARLGHELAFLCEDDPQQDRRMIPLPEGTPDWCIAHTGVAGALSALRDWKPDLIYTHLVFRPELERELLGIAPAVLFAHGYMGTCITGAKAFKSPTAEPCGRRFGWECLVHYYPRRCGGLSPITMLKDYRSTVKRAALLSEYRAVVTNSTHLRSEYGKHVADRSRVHVVPLPVTVEEADPVPAALPSVGKESWDLLFLGRMDSLKGGHLLIDALPSVASILDRPVRVTFAGDGPERAAWERRSETVQSRDPRISVEFVGWTEGGALESLWARTDLLVVPSVWPEPFGMVGPEAGLRGVPVAAFAVGGIPDWLIEGVNGHLAPGNPPTAEGLADAVVRCLRDPGTHASLGRGGREVARRFSRSAHLDALMGIFREAVGG